MQSRGNDYFYDAGRLNYCEKCGEKLPEEDIHTTKEFMGMCGLARAMETRLLGYACSNCGYEEEY